MGNILFEDHSVGRLRPLSASVPAYEIRCGIFNTRERLEIVVPGKGGRLLCRTELRALHTAPGWSTEVSSITERSLWINGRVGPDANLIKALYEQRDSDWALIDDYGLLAASLPSELADATLQSWRTWDGSAEAWGVPLDVAALGQPNGIESCELGAIWDIVPATAQAIATDLDLIAADVSHKRHPFGSFSNEPAVWSQAGTIRKIAADAPPSGAVVCGAGGLYLGSGGVDIAAGVHFDTSAGPIVLDSGVVVMPHSFLTGPLYIGRGTIVKAGSRIYGESSFGVGCRLAGEIGESTFGDFSNKQHDGFIGHAVLGSWVNLGAMTTCSDLKNNYGSVRINLGEGEFDTGQRFVGLMLGDHVKTAIGSLFNTGTVVGFASNIFGSEMPPKHVPAFSWGGAENAAQYDPLRAAKTAEIAFGRRQCQWTAAHANLFARIAQI